MLSVDSAYRFESWKTGATAFALADATPSPLSFATLADFLGSEVFYQEEFHQAQLPRRLVLLVVLVESVVRTDASILQTIPGS
jgi:hypothetical protein